MAVTSLMSNSRPEKRWWDPHHRKDPGLHGCRVYFDGDDTKFVPQLTTTYPLVIEILPQALQIVLAKLRSAYPDADIKIRIGDQKDGAVISDNGNLLADIRFTHTPKWQQLNIDVKMIPGIVEHSLFYGMATKAIIAGEGGIRVIIPKL